MKKSILFVVALLFCAIIFGQTNQNKKANSSWAKIWDKIQITSPTGGKETVLIYKVKTATSIPVVLDFIKEKNGHLIDSVILHEIWRREYLRINNHRWLVAPANSHNFVQGQYDVKPEFIRNWDFASEDMRRTERFVYDFPKNLDGLPKNSFIAILVRK